MENLDYITEDNLTEIISYATSVMLMDKTDNLMSYFLRGNHMLGCYKKTVISVGGNPNNVNFRYDFIEGYENGKTKIICFGRKDDYCLVVNVPLDVFNAYGSEIMNR